MDWTAVALVGVTGAVTLGAVFLQSKLSRGEALRVERKEHQREGRDIVVELAMMVRESDHIRYVINTNEAMRAELIERRQHSAPSRSAFFYGRAMKKTRQWQTGSPS